MKKYFLILYFIIFGCNISNAQPYFSKMFDLFQSWESAYEILDQKANSFTMVGDFVNPYDLAHDSLKRGLVFVSKFDTQFNFTNYLVFGKSGYEFDYVTSFKSGNTNKIVTAKLDANTISYIMYSLNDSLTDTISSLLIDCPVQNFYYRSSVKYDSRLYFMGIEGNSSLANLAILCTDTNGNRLWYKKYTNKRDVPHSSTVDRYGNFLISGTNWRGVPPVDTAFGWYAKIDTSGNFIWEKVMDGKSAFPADYAYVTKANGNYFIWGWNGGGFPSQIQDSSYAYIAQIDSLGSVKWRNNFLYTDKDKYCSVGSFVYRNNYLYANGNYETSEGWAGYTQYIALIKLDLQGNLIWKRLFKQWYQGSRSFSLKSVVDGFIICGSGKDTTHTTGYSDAWVIKTDTNGCVIPGCNAHDGIVQIINLEAFLKVYPNPASTELNIEITDEHAKAKNFFMYDNIGNLVTQKNAITESRNYIFPTSEIKNGAYYFVIELQDGSQAVKKILIQK